MRVTQAAIFFLLVSGFVFWIFTWLKDYQIKTGTAVAISLLVGILAAVAAYRR